MSDVVDRAAKAIHEAMDITDGLDSTAAETYARAAIEAIEPTDEMEQAFMAQGYKRMNFKLQFKAAMKAALGKVDA